MIRVLIEPRSVKRVESATTKVLQKAIREAGNKTAQMCRKIIKNTYPKMKMSELRRGDRKKITFKLYSPKTTGKIYGTVRIRKYHPSAARFVLPSSKPKSRKDPALLLVNIGRRGERAKRMQIKAFPVVFRGSQEVVITRYKRRQAPFISKPMNPFKSTVQYKTKSVVRYNYGLFQLILPSFQAVIKPHLPALKKASGRFINQALSRS